MNLRTRFLAFAVLLLFPVLLLHSQAMPVSPTHVPAWITVAPESATTAVVLPAGATYRFGDSAHNLWSQAITVTVPTTLGSLYLPAGAFPFSDPDPGTVKELDVLQTAAPQSILVTDLTVTPAVTVTQVIAGTASANLIAVQPGTSHAVTFSQFAIAQGSDTPAPSVAFVDAPATLANRGWQGTQLNVVIDGVTLVCAPGPTATDDSLTLSCTVPAPATP